MSFQLSNWHCRTGLLLLVMVLLMPVLSCQRSLYEDATALAKLKKAGQPSISFHFQQPDSVEFTALNRDMVLDDFKNPLIPRPLETNKYYRFIISGQLEGDYAVVQLRDTLMRVLIEEGSKRNNFYLHRDSIVLEFVIDYEAFNDGVQVIPNWGGNGVGPGELLYERSISHTEKDGYSLYLQHEIADFYLDRGGVFDGEDLKLVYLDNPFLWESYNKEIIQKNTTNFSHLSGFSTYIYRVANGKDNYLSRYYRDYPYRKIIEGDSLLEFRKQLSVATTTSSYRSQIVTAQKQLTEANSVIEEQRKKRGLLDANTVAVGLSDFIAERAQEELNLTFFNRFKEKLRKDSELTKLFPATRNLLFKFEISNYKTFLAHARETFENDLDNLGLNVPGILDLPKYRSLKDDPNVYNLSLIYSVADLAYREQPVENILLATLQDLRQRNVYLDESINLAITDSLVGSAATLANNNALANYRKELLAYFDEVEDCSRNLKRFNVQLSGLLDAENDFGESGIYQNLTNADRVSVLNVIGLKSNLAKDSLVINTNAFLSAADDRAKQSLSPLKHASNYLSNTLEGDEYFYYDISSVDDDDAYFKEYFSREAAPLSEVLVQGVDASREFLQYDFTGKFEQSLALMNGGIDTLANLKKIKLINENLAADAILKRIDIAFDKYGLIADVIGWEIDFWRMVSGEDEHNHYIAGLQYLMDYNYATVFNFSPSSLDGYSSVTANPESYGADVDEMNLRKASPATLSFVAARAAGLENHLDGIIDRLMDQRERLQKAFGGLSFSRGLSPEDLWYGSKFDSIAYTRGESVAAVLDRYPNPHLEAYRGLEGVDVDKSLVNDGQIATLKETAFGPLRAQVKRVEEQRTRLISMLAEMENMHAEKLVKARKSAQNLETVMELSSHLLFAFRDYHSAYDTLYYQDTQRIEVTVQMPKGTNGLVSTYTKDSLAITPRVVPGTTERVTAARWISRKEFADLRKDEYAWNAFLGLLYQRLRTVDGAPDFSPQGVAIVATKFLELANDMEEQRNNLRRKRAGNPKSISFKDYYPFIRSTVDLFNTIITAPLVGEEGKTLAQKTKGLRMVPIISDEALSLYENIFVKDYGNAILNATELLKIITSNEDEYLLSLPGADPEGLDLPTKLTKSERKRRSGDQRGINGVFRYGSFMASMIDAQSSDQVKAILKSTTLPPGSSRIKREVVSNFTVNSYLGAAAGRDRLLDAPANINPDALGAALSVPIGLTYSFSPNFLRNSSSFSIHVPLLDLGAITAYRSNPNGETANIDNLPELEWKNLFSPGLYLIYNFADSPFSLGVGGQYGPQLRGIEQANGEPLFVNSLRLPMAFISVDVPFYNLHTGARKITVR